MTSAWAGPVLDFWFAELGESHWWRKDPAVDAAIRARFGELHAALTSGAEPLDTNAVTALAAVIVLDQFSRNLYRDDPRAFAADPQARELARTIFARGWDAGLSREQRLFAALPFAHSEDRQDQARAVELITALGNADWTNFALAHQSLIERFGRFPHRNAVLGRASTPEEIAALREPMSSF